MSLIRSLFERVVDNLRARVRRVDLPTQLPRNSEELLRLAEGAVRQLLMPPSVGGTLAEVEPPAERAPGPTRQSPQSPQSPQSVQSVQPVPLAPAAVPPQTPRPVDALEQTPPMAIEASKFDLGPIAPRRAAVVDLDASLPAFPEGYGDARIFLLPRSPHWLLALWDFSAAQKSVARSTGGNVLGLRLFDVTDRHAPGRLAAETRVDELARSYYVHVSPGRSYVAELGYWHMDGAFTSLGRSADAETPAAAARPGKPVYATIDYDRPEPARVSAFLAQAGLTVASSLTRAVAGAIGRGDEARSPSKAHLAHAAAESQTGATGEPGAGPFSAPGSGAHVLWGGLSEPGTLPTSS